MGRCKTLARLATSAILLILAFNTGLSGAAEFSADMTDTQGETVKKGKLYVKGTKYSMFLEEGGEQLQVIVDTEQKMTVVVVMSAREFRVIPSDHMMSVMNDPFQGYVYSASMGEEKKTGTETVNGFECDRYTVTMQDTEVMSKWVAKKLDFPIRILAHGAPERIMELSNITEGPVEKEKLKIPEGFTKWVDPESLPVEIPVWAAGLETAPVMAPPFEQEMNAGDIVQVEVVPGKSLAIKAVSKTDEEAEAKVIPFKDGRPLKKESYYNNFAQKGTVCVRQHETPAVTDEYVVYVYAGNITATAKWQEMTEQDVAAGEEFHYKVVGNENIETYMVNIGDGETVIVYEYYKNGAPMSEDENGPLKWRTKTLKESLEIKKTTLVAKGDEVVVKVEKGKVQIKMGQYDSFVF